AHTASDARDRDAPRLCHTSAADRLSHGGGDGHRCRSAAQSGQVGYGRMTGHMNQIDRDAGIASAAPPPTRTGPFHHGLVGRLRTYFLTGLILVAPAYITISLTWWFINWVDDLVRPFIPVAYRPETYLPITIPGTGLILPFVTLTLLA